MILFILLFILLTAMGGIQLAVDGGGMDVRVCERES